MKSAGRLPSSSSLLSRRSTVVKRNWRDLVSSDCRPRFRRRASTSSMFWMSWASGQKAASRGRGETATRFVRMGLADKLTLFYAPKLPSLRAYP